jgi:hypothetical protein
LLVFSIERSFELRLGSADMKIVISGRGSLWLDSAENGIAGKGTTIVESHNSHVVWVRMMVAPNPFPSPPFPATLSHPHHHARALAMDPTVAALAKAAGLDKALAEFPDDIEAAAAQALGHAEAIKYPTDPAAEPWPPMRAEPTL